MLFREFIFPGVKCTLVSPSEPWLPVSGLGEDFLPVVYVLCAGIMEPNLAVVYDEDLPA